MDLTVPLSNPFSKTSAMMDISLGFHGSEQAKTGWIHDATRPAGCVQPSVKEESGGKKANQGFPRRTTRLLVYESTIEYRTQGTKYFTIKSTPGRMIP